MQLRRRGTEVAALGVVLTLSAVLLDSVLPLVGLGLVGAALLARQATFLRTVLALAEDLDIEQTVDRSLVTSGESVTLSLTASATTGRPATVTVTADPPMTARLGNADPPTVDLSRIERGHAEATIACPVAGRLTIPAPLIRVADADGLFATTFHRGPSTDVVVEATRPRRLHVGQGGDPLPTAFGDHETEATGTGTTPAELREYQPGDPAARIDWKATARLTDPYVRQFEAETDLETVLLLDHRATMATGDPGTGTQLAFLREVAMAYVGQAEDRSDPIGLVGIGDEGLTHRHWPAGGPAHYDRLRSLLLDLTPTESTSEATQPQTDARLPAAVAREIGDRLRADRPFDERLRPFFVDRGRYVEHVAADPLFAAARLTADQLGTHRVTIILTDDQRRRELLETVKLARTPGSRVLVFLTPGCLFTPGGLANLAAAYDEYVEFEDLRRELDGLDGVTAFEVAPSDRIGALLDAHRHRRATA